MKRLAALLIIGVPSIASAHPGHEHVGIAETHHLSSLGMVIAAAVGAGVVLAVGRYLGRNRSDK